MLRSLKAKFVLAFGTLIVLLFTALGFFLVNEKTNELSADIAAGTEAFAEFTAAKVVKDYHLNLEPGNYISYVRAISAALRLNPDITAISLSTYSGVLLFDSEAEASERYSGVLRTLDTETLQRVQSGKKSLLLDNGRLVYVMTDEDKNVSYVDFNEQAVDPLVPSDRIQNIIIPYDNSYGVIYTVSYAGMEERLSSARMNIMTVALIGLLLTLMLSTMLSVSITRPLNALKEGALKIANGDFSARVLVKTRDEIGLLAGTFNQMAADLAASIEAKLYKERVTHELALAADIQSNLIPRNSLALPSLDIAGGIIPATEVGGDAFDYITMENGDELIYLGDGTGHGVPAGIMASISNALLFAFRGEDNLLKVAKIMNDVIQKKSSNTMFITMALTVWNEAKSTLKYVNAGHLPLLYFDAAGKKLTEVRIQGMALGMVDEIGPYLKEQNIVLRPGDVVVIYTDGIPDAQNDRKEPYGVQRLKMCVQGLANEGRSAEEIKQGILEDVTKFIGAREHLDDITVVVMKKH